MQRQLYGVNGTGDDQKRPFRHVNKDATSIPFSEATVCFTLGIVSEVKPQTRAEDQVQHLTKLQRVDKYTYIGLRNRVIHFLTISNTLLPPEMPLIFIQKDSLIPEHCPCFLSKFHSCFIPPGLKKKKRKKPNSGNKYTQLKQMRLQTWKPKKQNSKDEIASPEDASKTDVRENKSPKFLVLSILLRVKP